MRQAEENYRATNHCNIEQYPNFRSTNHYTLNISFQQHQLKNKIIIIWLNKYTIYSGNHSYCNPTYVVLGQSCPKHQRLHRPSCFLLTKPFRRCTCECKPTGFRFCTLRTLIDNHFRVIFYTVGKRKKQPFSSSNLH